MTADNMSQQSTNRNDRYERGLQILAQVEQVQGPSVLDYVAEFSPDLARLTAELGYADVYSRPGLTYEQRQILTIAALGAMGTAPSQLRFHIRGALNVGCTPEQIIETFIHLTIYSGFPAALNAFSAAREVFTERGIRPSLEEHRTEPSERFETGSRLVAEVDGSAGDSVIKSLQDISPDLGRMIVEYSFGDVYSRPNLSLWERELVTVASCGAMGTCTPQLRVHTHGFLNVGGTREQLIEVAIQLAVYAGFPAALNTLEVFRGVLEQHENAG